MNTLSAAQLNDRLTRGERVQLVDVRTPAEYAEGHIPGALNLPMDLAEARIDDLSTQGEVVLVCQSGSRAGVTCELLRAHRPNLTVLDGGTKGWIDAGLPVVGSAVSRLPIIRQVHIGAGSLVLTGTLLSLFVHPGWIGLAIFVGAGLFVAGSTGFCGMAFLLAKMPWNRTAPASAPSAAPACGK